MKERHRTSFTLAFIFSWGAALACSGLTYLVYGKTLVHESIFWSIVFLPSGIFFLNRHYAKNLRILDMIEHDTFAGQGAELHLVVKNGKAPCCDATARTDDYALTYDLGPCESKIFVLRMPGQARGMYTTPNVKLGTWFPFIVFQTWKDIPTDLQYAVYPELEKSPPPFPENLYIKKKTRQGEDITGLREYFYGDTLSSVDWKASARSNELIVREYEHSHMNSLVFSQESVKGLDKEHGLSRLAAWLQKAENEKMRYELIWGKHKSGVGSGMAHLQKCLRILAAA